MIKYDGVKGELYGFVSKLYLNPLKALVYKGCYLMYRQIAWGSRYASLSPRRHAVRFTIPENGILKTSLPAVQTSTQRKLR
jgi:hypothetical protein